MAWRYFETLGPRNSLIPHIVIIGSFYWAKSRLEELANVSLGNVVFLHHHTYSTTPYFMPDYVGMDNGALSSLFYGFMLSHSLCFIEDRQNIKSMFTRIPFNVTKIWGAITGHMHFWDVQKSMLDTFTQWYAANLFSFN